jgi:hypothetical protein
MFTSLSNLQSVALKVTLVYIHVSGKSYCYIKVALSDRVPLYYKAKDSSRSSPLQRRLIYVRVIGEI